MRGVGQEAVEDLLLKEEGEYEILWSGRSSVWFLPESWSDIIPENSTVWESLKRRVSIACWFEFLEKQISIHFELSKMRDKQLRLKCAKKLQEAGFRLDERAFNMDATYSRFFGGTQKVSDMTDYEAVRGAVEKLFKKAKGEFPKAEKVFREVFN